MTRTAKAAKYDIKEDLPLLHLEFALKYDDLNLAFVKEVFKNIEKYVIAKNIASVGWWII